MSDVRSFRDLIVWQKALNLVTEVYDATRKFPREEIYGLTAQIRRSAVSIPSNLAEGHGRGSRADYARFVAIATGSLYEFQTQLQIASNLKFLSVECFSRLNDSSREIERMLCSLSRKLTGTGRPRENR